MDETTKKCPYCAETILQEAIKCKHCGSKLDPQTNEKSTDTNEPSPAKTDEVVYNTTWPFFFQSGPGYWKAKPSYWIGWVIGFITLPVAGLGIAIFAFLFVASLISRGDWKKIEIQRAIESKK